MNLQQALASESLQHRAVKEVCPCEQPRVSALQLAKKIFHVAASRDEPFTGLTSKSWAQKWLASEEFVLMEIPITAAATPSMPFNRNRVLENLHSAADMVSPIVVDLNKRGVGRSPSGQFTPPVIVVDGKHRITAARLQGQEMIKAWVGVRAINKLSIPNRLTMKASGKTSLTSLPTRMDAAAQLSAGMNMTPVPRQDVGDGGSAPTGRPAMAGSPSGSKFIKERGVRADASDASDKKSVQDPSDEDWPPEASDRKPGMRYDKNQTSTGKDQMNDASEVNTVGGDKTYDPAKQSPGSGVGPRADNSRSLGMGRHKGGASRSELTKVLGKGKSMDCKCPGSMHGKHMDGCMAGKIPGKIRTKARSKA